MSLMNSPNMNIETVLERINQTQPMWVFKYFFVNAVSFVLAGCSTWVARDRRGRSGFTALKG